MLGIGVITRNRLTILRETLAKVERLTNAPYVLIVADDGSGDGTAAWARRHGLPIVTGPRRGCAWNKNRALFYLMTRTRCDPLLLLEDDTRPTKPGWQDEWIASAMRWSHVNYCYGFDARDPPPGRGTAVDPYRCSAFGGHCTITTRSALLKVGYLDSRFRGYGWEHVEWTWRFHLRYRHRWAMPDSVPCLDRGVAATWPPSTFNRAEQEANEATYTAIRARIIGPYWRGAWHTDDERLALTNEVAAAS